MPAAGRWYSRRMGTAVGSFSRSGSGCSEADVTIAPIHHILPLTTVIRERLLPVKGTVLARLGQKVNSADVVAEATWAREHIFLDISRILNITPDAADKLIRCKAGDSLPAGAVVAKGGGILPRIIKAQ